MKKLLLPVFALFLALASLETIAQQYKQVDFEKVKISKGEQPAYVINIPNAGLLAVTKDWEKTIRQNTKSKVEEINGEISINVTQIDAVYHNPINIYSLIYKVDTLVKLVAAFEIDSAFFDFKERDETHVDQKTQNQIINFMQTFAVAQYKNVVTGELDFEEEKLVQLNNDLKDLEKDLEDFQKDIKGNEQKIKNSNDAIQTYESENSRLLTSIADKNIEVAGQAGNDVAQKKAKDELKSLEKEKKSVENNLDKEQKRIVEYESGINSMNREVDENQKQQEEVQANIETQQGLVKAVKAKLEAIK